MEDRPPLIHPNAVYTLVTARAALGMPKTALTKEIRQGRLRVSKRNRRYFILWQLSIA